MKKLELGRIIELSKSDQSQEEPENTQKINKTMIGFRPSREKEGRPLDPIGFIREKEETREETKKIGSIGFRGKDKE